MKEEGEEKKSSERDGGKQKSMNRCEKRDEKSRKECPEICLHGVDVDESNLLFEGKRQKSREDRERTERLLFLHALDE